MGYNVYKLRQELYMTRQDFLAHLPELVAKYQPSAEVLRKIGSISLLMIIGPSGSGKTTLINNLNLPYVASDTSRPPRLGESDGIDYHFHTDYESLQQKIINGDFVQVAVGSGGDFYGTKASSYPDSGMAVMAVMADVIPIFRQLGFGQTTSAFIAPPSFSEWQRRMGDHQLTKDQLKKRLHEARRSFNFALDDKQTHLILNDHLEAAQLQLENLIKGDIDNQREAQARVCIGQILDKLKHTAANEL